MQPTASIHGSEEVVSALGYWPSFHDAEVLSFTLERGARPEEKRSVARISVHVRQYEPRHEGTAEFEMALVQNVVVTLCFEDVEAIEVEDFNFQNVINSLQILPEAEVPSALLRVEVESIYGFGARWLCKSARVESVSKLATSEA